jgi:hypothetical protein
MNLISQISRKAIVFFSIAGLVVAVIAATGTLGWQYHEKPIFCATCHVMQPYLQSWSGEKKGDPGSDLLASLHGAEGIGCLECHPADMKHQISELVVFVKGEYSEPLEQRQFPDEFCTGCHSEEGDRIAATQDYTVQINLTDEFRGKLIAAGNEALAEPTLVKVNPHTVGVDYSDSSDPHKVDAPRPECYTCHHSHQTSPKINSCFTCHHSQSFIACGSCHVE